MTPAPRLLVAAPPAAGLLGDRLGTATLLVALALALLVAGLLLLRRR